MERKGVEMISRNLGLFSARLTNDEVFVCSQDFIGERSLLSPIPPPNTSVSGGDSQIWTGLVTKQIAAPDLDRLKLVWQDAFRVLAEPTTRWRLLLGEAQWIEEGVYYAARPLDEDELVAYVAGEDEHRISFPVSPQDVIALVENHLAAESATEQTGFWKNLTTVEYATLLAVAELGPKTWSEFEGERIVEQWQQAEANRDGQSPTGWGWIIVPRGALELDPSSVSYALSLLQDRGLLTLLEGSRYAPSFELVGLLSSLKQMERYAVIDFWMQNGQGELQNIYFVFVFGNGALWLLDFGGQYADNSRVVLRSITPLHVDRMLEHLVELTWLPTILTDDKIGPTKEGDLMFNAHLANRPMLGHSPPEFAPRARFSRKRTLADIRRLILLHIEELPQQLKRQPNRLDILRSEGKYAWRFWWAQNAGTGTEVPVWIRLIDRMKSDLTYTPSPDKLSEAWAEFIQFFDLSDQLGGVQ
jgi:hypothetical protein